MKISADPGETGNLKGAGKMKRKRLIAIVMAAVMMLSMIPAIAFADSTSISNVEWWNFRNNEENNGVTDRETPTCMEETTQKWSKQVAPNYTDSCTPPLILDGYLYTAQGRYVYKLDKETGKKVAESVKLDGQIGYAMNPIIYADGELYIQINNGRVQALDAVTLKSLWVSEEVGGQTLSPITYKNGYIYTSTWESETKDGAYFCINTKKDPDPSTAARECEWKFIPSQRDMGAKGFYWAGCYASDNYVAFGMDDGDGGCSSQTSYFVTVDPKTGEIIDKLEGLDGDIRTTTVYHGGYLYFATKGGTLYKVPADKDGKLGNPVSLEMNGMMTAAPVVHNGRIYIGVCGQGGQFDKDGGHCFAVVNDDDMSLAYTVPIKGYPQAAALLSTAANQNGDGKVYLYFTYNSYPGGIYFFTDSPEQTEATDPQVLFEPPVEQQQYCISTISCDADGTLYYKNDSGYLMAVTKNRSYIKNISISADSGEVSWSKDFNAGFLNYDIIIEAGVKTVDVTLDVPGGMDKVTVDGQEYKGDTVTVTLDATGEKTLDITVTAGEDSRTYTLNIRGKGSNANLSSLVLSNSNSYTNSQNQSNQYKLNPSFDPAVTEYNTDVITTNIDFVRLWPEAAESNSTIEVYPVENVELKKYDEETGFQAQVYNSEHSYYPIYPTSGETDSKVKIKVTSESGSAVQEYYVTIIRDKSVSGAKIALNKTSSTIYTKAPGNTVKLKAALTNSEEKIAWESNDETIATVGTDGTVKGLKKGTAIITASIPNGRERAEASCEVTVKSPTLYLNKSSATIYTCSGYKNVTLTAKVNGYSKQKATWKVTSGSKYVSVNSSGKVTAKKAGKATISAKANGITKTCKITVKSPVLTLSKTSATIKKNKTVTIKIKKNTPKGTVKYSSKNKKIATVTSKGVVKGKKKGSTTIYVKCNGITKTFKVKVK